MAHRLNTQVHGNPETLWRAADYLNRAADGSQRAANLARQAGSTADSGWDGPARDAYAMKTGRFSPDVGQLADIASRNGRATQELGDTLATVIRRMNDATSKAGAGGLRVEGPFILPPDPPAAPPMLPTGPCGTAQATKAMAENRAAREAHGAAVADFNAKRKVYNECKAIVSDARNLEENAHDAIQRIGGPPDKPHDWVSGLLTLAATARDVAGGVENARKELLKKADDILATGKQFTDFTFGHYSRLPSSFRQTLTWAAGASTVGAKPYQLRADDYHRMMGKMPQKLLDWIVTHPTTPPAEMPQNVRFQANKFLSGLPYAGAGLTAFIEARQAVRGEQSWGKAVVDTGATLGGGAIAGFGSGLIYGAISGAPTGPGAIVTGLIGGIAGSIAGQHVADIVVPK